MSTDTSLRNAASDVVDRPESDGTTEHRSRQVTLTVPRIPDLGGWARRLVGGSGGGGAWSPRLWAGVGLVLAALLALNLWLLDERDDDAGIGAARAAALEEARTRVPTLLSYSSDTLADDLARAKEQTTGDFGDDYATLLDDVVLPNARRHEISTDAVVEASAVVDAADDEVVVLVFLTQTTLSQGAAVPQVSGSRIEVTMAEVDGRWLIAGLEPV